MWLIILFFSIILCAVIGYAVDSAGSAQPSTRNSAKNEPDAPMATFEDVELTFMSILNKDTGEMKTRIRPATRVKVQLFITDTDIRTPGIAITKLYHLRI